MRPYTRITGILAILVLMVAGAWANAQSANKKAGDSLATSNAGTSASSKNKVKTNGGLQSVQSNPLYKDNREGTNPLYERDSAAKTKAPSSGATMSHEVVEYKDNDDRTTRYRPGNNKTAKVTPTGNTAGAAVVEYKDGEDGTMHTRPSNPK
jgi:FtsZ-interacting cell division protein ZipA